MDIELLRIFVDVANNGSFAAVARMRGLDPSSISRMVAALEESIGVRLLQRSTRRLALTEAGRLYLGKVEAIVDELEHARDEALQISSRPGGTLRLTTSVAFGQVQILPLLPMFRARYPGVRLDCVFTDENLDLVTNGIDLAIRLGPGISGDYVITKLLDTQYRAVASADYVARAGAVRRPTDIGNHECLLFPFRRFQTHWHFRDRAGNVTEVPVRGSVTLSTALALRDAALAGMGIALLPDWLVGDLVRAGELVDLFPKHQAAAETFETGAWLVYPSRSFLPAKVRVMIDFLKAHLATGVELKR